MSMVGREDLLDQFGQGQLSFLYIRIRLHVCIQRFAFSLYPLSHLNSVNFFNRKSMTEFIKVQRYGIK